MDNHMGKITVFKKLFLTLYIYCELNLMLVFGYKYPCIPQMLNDFR